MDIFLYVTWEKIGKQKCFGIKLAEKKHFSNITLKLISKIIH